MRYAAYPNNCSDNSERNAPTRPAKFTGAWLPPVVKNHTGSDGSCVTSEMSQISASANSATPTNSLIRREKVDSATTSDLHEYWKHQRPSSRPLLEETPQLHPKLFGHQSLIRPLFHAGFGDASSDHLSRVAEERVALAGVDHESASDDLRIASKRTGMTANCHNRDDHTVGREVPSIAKYLVTHLADARHIDQHPTRWRLLGNASALIVELNDVTVLSEEYLDLAVGPAHHPRGYPCVLREVTILTVYWDEIARPHEREDELQLFG